MAQERLSSLLRQRALLTQHLAWLDAEIADAQGAPPAAPYTPPTLPSTPDKSPAPAPVPAVPVSPPVNVEPAPVEPDPVNLANQRADQIIASYSAVDRFDPSATKRGCIALAAGALFIMFGIFAVWYFFRYNR
ncbi:MAG: hypothetical protein RL376_1222 [Verrucomicrobiota bacterium]|jgi:hypothetical protein